MLRPLVVVCASWLLLAATPARAAINRCEGADGSIAFTDRSCDQLGMAERLPRSRPGAANVAHGEPRGPRFGIGCAAHEPDDMRSALRIALQSGDVNSIAGLYDWRGASSRSARWTLQRMRALARKTLVAIDIDEYAMVEAGPMLIAASNASDLPALRVDYYAYPDGGPIESTRFSLRRELGCVWLAD